MIPSDRIRALAFKSYRAEYEARHPFLVMFVPNVYWQIKGIIRYLDEQYADNPTKEVGKEIGQSS